MIEWVLRFWFEYFLLPLFHHMAYNIAFYIILYVNIVFFSLQYFYICKYYVPCDAFAACYSLGEVKRYLWSAYIRIHVYGYEIRRANRASVGSVLYLYHDKIQVHNYTYMLLYTTAPCTHIRKCNVICKLNLFPYIYEKLKKFIWHM